ncbi:hypothetical protein [Paraburkholderia diazotrophica]|uniref:hypothetical protein n=1 Tax=Paraburkholderia diazotrophica TaxID=667676 RepID=UPI003172E33B
MKSMNSGPFAFLRYVLFICVLIDHALEKQAPAGLHVCRRAVGPNTTTMNDKLLISTEY